MGLSILNFALDCDPCISAGKDLWGVHQVSGIGVGRKKTAINVLRDQWLSRNSVVQLGDVYIGFMLLKKLISVFHWYELATNQEALQSLLSPERMCS